jgi:hypothetical protein
MRTPVLGAGLLSHANLCTSLLRALPNAAMDPPVPWRLSSSNTAPTGWPRHSSKAGRRGSGLEDTLHHIADKKA